MENYQKVEKIGEGTLHLNFFRFLSVLRQDSSFDFKYSIKIYNMLQFDFLRKQIKPFFIKYNERNQAFYLILLFFLLL